MSDAISEGLQRIVEFLNERMTPTEVLAAEVRQYVSDDDKQLLHARLVGATARAREVKRTTQRRTVINVLVENGRLQDGDPLWLTPTMLPPAIRPAADDERLRLTLRFQGGRASLLYQRDGTSPAEEFTPSTAWNRVNRGMTLSFMKKGVYRLGTRTVEMPGLGMDVKTIGPDNHLRLVVTVA